MDSLTHRISIYDSTRCAVPGNVYRSFYSTLFISISQSSRRESHSFRFSASPHLRIISLPVCDLKSSPSQVAPLTSNVYIQSLPRHRWRRYKTHLQLSQPAVNQCPVLHLRLITRSRSLVDARQAHREIERKNEYIAGTSDSRKGNKKLAIKTLS